MGFTSYTSYEKTELMRAVKGSDLDYFYIADSYGSLFPHEVKALFEPFLELNGFKVGFHPHNSLQMAFANTLEAIKVGVDIVDSSIYGMGRGSGNLPTEVLIALLEVKGNKKYNAIPILSCVDQFFVDLMKKNPWGYQLPFMISGMFKCHPYYATEFVKRREYSVEDIWKALEVIEEMKPIGFDRTIVEDLIKKGVVGTLGKKALNSEKKLSIGKKDKKTAKVPYINRHHGKDILVLANGPSLKKYQREIQNFIEKYDPIVLGANYLSGLFEPHYHAFNNKKRFVMYCDSVSPRSTLLIGENISREMISEYIKRDYETLFFRDILDSDFDIRNGRIQSNCRTISVLLLGVAVVMGARRIFVAGMDGYINKNSFKGTLFYDEEFEPEEERLNIERHQWNERFFKQIDQYVQRMGMEGIHILTPTGHQSFYKGIENYI
jgi:4-hydroxy 2-oxovalerate aldolase